MTAVVDSGVVADTLIDTAGPAAQTMAEAGALAAPPLMWLEVQNRLRRLVHHGPLPRAQAELAVERLLALPIRSHDEVGLLPRIWELCSNLTPYDACYVALAEHLGARLVTGDARLARAPGLRCSVQLVA